MNRTYGIVGANANSLPHMYLGAIVALFALAGALAAQPQIVSVSPAEGTSTGNVLTPISVTFDVPANGVDFDSFVISGSMTGRRLSGSGTFESADSGKLKTFIPDASQPFQRGETVRVTLTTAIHDPFQTWITLDAPFCWSFMIGSDPSGSTGYAWTTGIKVDSPAAVYRVALGDLNGDGWLDIVAGAGGTYGSAARNQDSVYLNDRTGAFDAQAAIAIGAGDNNLHSVALGDMNGDGLIDIVTANRDSADYVLLNAGGNSPGLDTMIEFGDLISTERGVIAVDLNGDGALDIGACSRSSGSGGALINYTFLSDGKDVPSFAEVLVRSTGLTAGVAFADVDNDGDLDAIEANRMHNSSAQDWVRRNNGHGKFPDGDKIAFGTGSDRGNAVAAADMNSDGFVDIVLANLNEQSIVYLSNGNPADLKFPAGVDFGTPPSYADAVLAADLNGDGHMDIVLADWHKYCNVSISSGGAMPSFTSGVLNPANSSDSIWGVTAGDLDHDGCIDIVAAAGYSDGVSFSDGVWTYLGSPAFPPTIDTITPNHGPRQSSASTGSAGPANIVITGTKLDQVVGVLFGSEPGTDLSVQSATQLTIDAPNAPATGTVDVTLLYLGGSVTAANAFTYDLPVPVISNSYPQWSAFYVSGYAGAQFYGEFLDTVSEIRFDGVAGTNLVVQSSSALLIDVPPAAAPGTVDMDIVYPDGIVSMFLPYYDIPAPRIFNLTPDHGAIAGGTTVELNGDRFVNAANVQSVTFAGIEATNIVLYGDTRLTCVTPAHAAGAVDITVTTAGGTDTISGGFTYGAPTVTSVSPDSGHLSGGYSVDIAGTDFLGVTGIMFGAIPATSFQYISPVLLKCTVPPGSAAGDVDVAVTTSVGTSTQNGQFTYDPIASGLPMIASATPDRGPLSGGTTVALTGSGFLGATAVTFGGVDALGFAAVNNTNLTCVTPPSIAGVADIIVTTLAGASVQVVQFTYENSPGGGLPIVAAVVPDRGPLLGGTTVVLGGSGFTGTISVTFGGVSAASFLELNDSNLSCVTPPSIAGVADIIVTTAAGASVQVVQFTYEQMPAALPPTIMGLSPASGPMSGGTLVSITGQGFLGATDVFFGSLRPTAIAIVSDVLIEAVTPASATAGAVSVTVTSANGSGVLPAAWTWLDDSPAPSTPRAPLSAGGGGCAASPSPASGGCLPVLALLMMIAVAARGRRPADH